MARLDGRWVSLAVGDGGEPENFMVLGGALLTRLAIGRRPVASAHLGDEGWQTLLGGVGARALSIAASGEFSGDVAEAVLRALAFSGAVAHWTMDFGAGGLVEAPCVVSSFERTAEYGQTLRYRLALESAGESVFTPA